MAFETPANTIESLIAYTKKLLATIPGSVLLLRKNGTAETSNQLESLEKSPNGGVPVELVPGAALPLPAGAAEEATLEKVLWGQSGSTAPVNVADPDGVMGATATMILAHVYSGGDLTGAKMLAGALIAPGNATITTAVHAATYKVGAPNAIVVTGTEYYTGGVVSEALVLTNVNGGETVSGAVLFAAGAALSYAVPGQNDALGSLTLGTGTLAAGIQRVHPTNTSGTVVNPSTEDTLALVLAAIKAGESVGGGNNIWSNGAGDFTATANVGAKTITFAAFTSTVLSSVIATLNFSAAVIKRVSSTGVVDTLPTTTVAYAAGVLTLADMTANFAAGDTVLVFLPGPDKAYNQTYDVTQVSGPTADDAAVTAPGVRISAKYLADIFATPVSASNNVAALITDMYRRLLVRGAAYDSLADADRTTPTSSDWDMQDAGDHSVTTAVGGSITTLNYVDMRGYGWFSLLYNAIVGTNLKSLTVQATNRDTDDASSLAAGDWEDITVELSGRETIYKPGMFVLQNQKRYTHIRTSVVTAAGGAADNTWALYPRKAR